MCLRNCSAAKKSIRTVCLHMAHSGKFKWIAQTKVDHSSIRSSLAFGIQFSIWWIGAALLLQIDGENPCRPNKIESIALPGLRTFSLHTGFPSTFALHTRHFWGESFIALRPLERFFDISDCVSYRSVCRVKHMTWLYKTWCNSTGPFWKQIGRTYRCWYSSTSNSCRRWWVCPVTLCDFLLFYRFNRMIYERV